MTNNLKVAIVQSNISWENATYNLQEFEKKIYSISQADIIVLPEMFNTGFSMKAKELAEPMNGETVVWMQRMAKQKNAVIVGSLIIVENDKYYNRLIWACPSGTITTYNKKHLFSLSFENENFEQGNEKCIVNYKGWNFLLVICYDIRFPVYCRNTPSKFDDYRGTYDGIIAIASWPHKRSLAWKVLLQARAIENQAYVIAVNRVGADGNDIDHSGHSSIIAPGGEIIFQNADKEIVYQTDIDMDVLIAQRRAYPFWKDADAFELKQIQSSVNPI
jgi:omega-amidase